MIEIIVVEGARHRRVQIESLPVVLGRSSDVDVPLDCARASRQHLSLEWDGEHIWAVDLEAANGTFVNGERISRHPLEQGDHLQVGDVELTYVGGVPAEEPELVPDVPGVHLEPGIERSIRYRMWQGVRAEDQRPVVVMSPRRAWLNDARANRVWIRRMRALRDDPAGDFQILDVGEDPMPWIVRYAVPGTDLPRALAENRGFTPSAAARLAKGMFATLEPWHAHGFALGTLHPEDWVVDSAGEPRLVQPGPPAAPESSEHANWCLSDGVLEGDDPRPTDDVATVGRIVIAACRDGVAPREAYDPRKLLSERELLRAGVPEALADLLLGFARSDSGEFVQDASEGRRAFDSAERSIQSVRQTATVSTAPGDGPSSAPARAGGRAAEEAGEAREEEAPRRVMKHGKRWKMMNRAIAAVIIIILNGGFFLFWRGCVVAEPDPAPSPQPGHSAPSEGGSRTAGRATGG